MKTSHCDCCQSLIGCTYPFLFHVADRSAKGTLWNMTVALR